MQSRIGKTTKCQSAKAPTYTPVARGQGENLATYAMSLLYSLHGWVENLLDA